MSYIKIFTGHTFPKNEILGNRIRSGVKLPSLGKFTPSDSFAKWDTHLAI